MPRFVELSDADRQFLRELQELTGLQQRELAERVTSVRITQPWISQMLTGSRPSVDPEMLEGFVNQLILILKNRQVDDHQFPAERRRVAFSFLSRFTTTADLIVPNEGTRPGGCVPVGAFYYQELPDERKVLDALRVTPFTMLVTGPVQSGKSSLLARLEHRARGIGLETAWFDPVLPLSHVFDTAGDRIAATPVAAASMYEQLQDIWGLEARKEGPPDSLSKLFNWLRKTLQPTASKPRLLIMDDLISLGLDGAEEWTSLFVRAVHNFARQDGIDLSIGVGMSYGFGTQVKRKLMGISSVVHWGPRTMVHWLDEPAATRLVEQVNATALAHAPFKYFAGQPYLTHAFAADEEFYGAAVSWIRDPNASEALRQSKVYRRHLAAIRAVMTDLMQRGTEMDKDLLEAFSSRVVNDEGHHYFLQQANLVKDGQYTIPLYALISADLRKENP